MPTIQIFKDPRLFQIAFLGTFLFFGVSILQWEVSSIALLSIFTIVIALQIGAIYHFKINKSSIQSAIISGLGLALLLKANETSTYILAATLSIASKFVIRYKGKHIFNPVNFGIIVSILITNDAWISPGQWGNQALYLFGIGIFSWLVLIKVKQLVNSVAFLGTLFLINYIYLHLYLEWPVDYVLHKFTSGSLLLFSFFMITDPRTTPNHTGSKIIWAVSIAIISFILTQFFHVNSSPFWVLFFVSPLTPIIDSFTTKKQFSWH